MIYINSHGIKSIRDGGIGTHIWIEGAVNDQGYGDQFEEDDVSLCGVSLDDIELVNDEPYLMPAEEKWTTALALLQGEDSLCEECRVRAAVYLGLIEDVDVWARTIATDQCGDHTPPVPAEYRIEGVKGDGIVVRRAVCPHPECGREISQDEVTIPDPDRRPFERR